jgi:hypothetical protein
MTQRSPQPPLPLIIAIFALAFLVPAWPWLSGAVTIPYDAKSTFLPPVEFMARAFHSGESPFWTPNIYAGWPLIADPQSMLTSPLHVLLALTGEGASFRANDAVVFAYLFAGGVAVILYFRDRGWHAAGALLAALALAFGGSANGRLQHIGQVMSLAYLPVAMLFLSRALDRGSWRYGALAGAAGALIALGRDQVALLELYVLGGYVLAHWCGAGFRTRLRASLLPLAADAIAGVLIIALPILFTELLATDSNRPEISFFNAGRGSMHYSHVLSLIFPDLFGAMDPKVPFWGTGGFAWNERFGMADLFLAQNMTLLYAGALGPLLLTFGALRGWLWSREIRFFSIVALFAAFYAFGRFTPAFHAMYELMPGVKLFRRPADATFVLGAMVAIMAGYALHRWLEAQPASARERAIAIALFAAATAAAIWLAGTIGVAANATKPIVTGLCFLLAAAVALHMVRRIRVPLAAVLLIGLFTCCDLAFNNAPHESTGLPPARFDVMRPDTQNETLALIRERLAAQPAGHRDRIELIGIGYHWPNICMIHGCEQVFGHNPLRLRWFYDATNVGDTVADMWQRRFSSLYPSYRSTLADLFGVRLIAISIPVEQFDKALKPGDLNLIARTKDAYVYENPRALPRVLMVGEWKLADFRELTASGWPPDVDPRKTVLLEKAPSTVPLPGTASAGTARLVRYGNAEIVVEVNSPTGGMLVLNDVWHPWWRATIDGADAEIMRANAIFRAVPVSPGNHTVRFTFEPLRGAWRELGEKMRGGECCESLSP